MADCKKFYENSVTGIRGDTRLLENKRACSGLGKNFYMGAWILFEQLLADGLGIAAFALYISCHSCGVKIQKIGRDQVVADAVFRDGGGQGIIAVNMPVPDVLHAVFMEQSHEGIDAEGTEYGRKMEKHVDGKDGFFREIPFLLQVFRFPQAKLQAYRFPVDELLIIDGSDGILLGFIEEPAACAAQDGGASIVGVVV